jgi:hypothetical protein
MARLPDRTLHGPADMTLRVVADRLAPHVGVRRSAPAHPLPTADRRRPDRDVLPLDLVVVPDASAEGLIEPLARLVTDGTADRAVWSQPTPTSSCRPGARPSSRWSTSTDAPPCGPDPERSSPTCWPPV